MSHCSWASSLGAHRPATRTTAMLLHPCMHLRVCVCMLSSQVEVSNMSHCKLGKQGAAALKAALGVNTAITSLNLEDNGLDAKVHRLGRLGRLGRVVHRSGGCDGQEGSAGWQHWHLASR